MFTESDYEHCVDTMKMFIIKFNCKHKRIFKSTTLLTDGYVRKSQINVNQVGAYMRSICSGSRCLPIEMYKTAEHRVYYIEEVFGTLQLSH